MKIVKTIIFQSQVKSITEKVSRR